MDTWNASRSISFQLTDIFSCYDLCEWSDIGSVRLVLGLLLLLILIWKTIWMIRPHMISMTLRWRPCSFLIRLPFPSTPNHLNRYICIPIQDIQDTKLLFYHPVETSVDEKRNQVGMAEGVFVFCDSFDPDSNVNVEYPRYHTIHLVE